MAGRKRELNPSSAWYRGAGLDRTSRRHRPGAAAAGDQQQQPSYNSATSVPFEET